MGLNPRLVDVDVLRFERLARVVLSGGSNVTPVETLEACSKIEQIYHTGFDRELCEQGGKVKERITELSALYVSCMVLGGSCALDQDDGNLALWFAHRAERVAPQRDDVRALLEGARHAAEKQATLEKSLEPVYETEPKPLGAEVHAVAAENVVCCV